MTGLDDHPADDSRFLLFGAHPPVTQELWPSKTSQRLAAGHMSLHVGTHRKQSVQSADQHIFLQGERELLCAGNATCYNIAKDELKFIDAPSETQEHKK